MHLIKKSAAALAAFGAGATLLGGCGGSGGGVGNTSTARIRVVDAAYLTNGDSAQIVINGGSVDGNTKYFDSGSSTNGSVAASPYLFVQPQNGASFTYTINNNNTSETTNNVNINQGQHYTAFLVGREDISGDLRNLQLILPAQQAGSTSGQATLRVLNAAPDAGYTPAVAPAAAMPGSITVTVGPSTFGPTTYATASNYQTLTPGSNLPVTVTLSGVGGTTIKTGTISVSAGTTYTLVVAEPTVTPAPAYDLRLLSE